MRDGKAIAQAAPLTVKDDKAGWFTLGEAADLPFGPGQVVLMRKDPPFDDQFLYDCLLYTSRCV